MVRLARRAAEEVPLSGWPLDGALVWLAFGLALGLLLGLLLAGRRLRSVRGELARREDELVALQAAGADVLAELSLEAVLHKVVARARELLGARYGAIAVYDESGAISSFLTSGIDAEQAQRIGPPPTGRGLLGVVMHEGQRLRLEQVSDDPRAVGFPPGHPPLRSLLALPLVCRTPFRGNLYVSEKAGGRAFDARDEEVLERFAVQAAIAVDNAHLHDRAASAAVSEERLRLAREMHDNEAQVLASVNAQAQAAGELVRAGRGDEARQQLEHLAGAARDVYADVRESILGLRSPVDGGLLPAISEYLASWGPLAGIEVIAEIDGAEPMLDSGAELQLLRIVQESLANVRRHSQARQVKVRGAAGPTAIELTVEDDGVGFDLARLVRGPRPRFGLATMRERAEAIGAVLEIDSTPGEGTRVSVRYSLPA